MKLYKSITLIISALLFSGTSRLEAQPGLSFQSIETLDSIWVSGYDKAMQFQLTSTDFQWVDKSWPVWDDPRVQKVNQDAAGYYNIKINQLRADRGINWNTSTQNNFSPQPGEENIIYRTRVQTGLEWNLLRSGLYENELKARQLENQRDLENLNQENYFQSSLTYKQRNAIIYHFNLFKIKILQERKGNLEREIQILEKLFPANLIESEDWIQAQKQLIEIHSQLNIYETFNESLEPLVDKKAIPDNSAILPMFDINTTALEQLSSFHPDFDKSMILQSENAKLADDWISKIALSSSLRYNYYDMIGNRNNRGFISLGFNASVPLSLLDKDYRKQAGIRVQSEKLKQSAKDEILWEQTSNLVYEFRYKLKQYRMLEEKQNVEKEQLRIYQGLRDGEEITFQPVMALKLLDEFWAAEIEKLDLRQQMYLILGQIQSQMPQFNTGQYVVPVNSNNKVEDRSFNTPIQLPTQGMYIWSKDWKKGNARDITFDCMKWNMQFLLVSIGNDGLTDLENLTRVAHSRQLDVEWMIGNNKWLFSPIDVKLDSIYQRCYQPEMDGFHLDIEPHAMEGFKENQASYFQLYISRLQEASAFCKKHQLKLGVSIPMHYPNEILEQIKPLVDEVVVMAYETNDLNAIQRRCEEEKTIFEKKFSIALRTQDYPSIAAIKTRVMELQKWIPSNRVILHDYSSFQTLNQK